MLRILRQIEDGEFSMSFFDNPKTLWNYATVHWGWLVAMWIETTLFLGGALIILTKHWNDGGVVVALLPGIVGLACLVIVVNIYRAKWRRRTLVRRGLWPKVVNAAAVQYRRERLGDIRWIKGQTVGVTIDQLQGLQEVLIAGDVDTAKAWLMAAIRQGREDLREGR